MSCFFDLFPKDDKSGWSLPENFSGNPTDEVPFFFLFNNDENDRDHDDDGIDDDVLEVLLLLEEDPPDTGQLDDDDDDDDPVSPPQATTTTKMMIDQPTSAVYEETFFSSLRDEEEEEQGNDEDIANNPFRSFVGGEYCQLVTATPPNGSCDPGKDTAFSTNNNNKTTPFVAPLETPLDQGKRLSRAWTLDQDEEEEEAPSKKRRKKEPHDSAFVQPRGKDPTVSLGDSPETNATPILLHLRHDDQGQPQDDSGGPTTTTHVANAASARPKRSPAVKLQKPSRRLVVKTDVVKPKKKRRPQLCRKCGEPRKFHVCKGIGREKVRERKVCGTQTPPNGILRVVDTEPGTRLVVPSRAKMDSLEKKKEEDDDDCSTKKRSGGYLCGRCGQKKKVTLVRLNPARFGFRHPLTTKTLPPSQETRC